MKITMFKKYNTLQKKALKHYDRMIKYAKKQNPNDPPAFLKMLDDIGETWYHLDCTYCNIFKDNCLLCSLSVHGSDSSSCCMGLWSYMDKSYTWKEWIGWAKLIKEYIKING